MWHLGIQVSHELVMVLGYHLVWMVLRVFSSLNDSVNLLLIPGWCWYCLNKTRSLDSSV